jgi:sulfur-oxidizing protein SoxX
LASPAAKQQENDAVAEPRGNTGGSMANCSQAVSFAFIAILGMSGVALAQNRTVSEPGLVPYTIVGHEIPKSLTGKPGDPAKGKKLANTRGVGFCPVCHVVPVEGEAFYGDIGPELKGVGSRLSEGELRLRLVNAKAVNPNTMMPAYYRSQGYHMVEKKFAGKTFMTAEQIEDMVAYLKTLK